MNRNQPHPTAAGPAGGLPALLGRVLAGLAASALLYLISQGNFPVFHGLVELSSVTITWGVFLLLWNARQYLENEAYLVLGLALALSGCVDLLHTLAYQGTNAFVATSPTDLAGQFWIAARGLETLGWAVFALGLGRRLPVRWLGAGFFGLGVWWVAAILHWKNFPVCFVEGTGLTVFKVAAEYAMAAILTGSLVVFGFRGRKLDRDVRWLMGAALILVIIAELAFTTYSDAYGFALVLGHSVRIVSRYLLYLALIRLSVIRPYSLFFGQLQREKDQIRQSEARWRTLSESSPDHILDLDTDLKIRFANYPNPGLAMADLLGHSILEFLPADDRQRVDAVLRQALTSGQPARYETVTQEPSGRLRYHETTAVARAGNDGQDGGLTLVSRNVTERKRHDQVLTARLRISEFALTSDIADLLQKVLDEGEKLTASSIGFFHFVDEDQENLHLQNWSTRTLRDMCTAEGRGQHYPITQAGVWADAIRTRRPVIHNDYPSLPNRKGMPPGHAPVAREVVIPLLRKDRVVAALGVGNKATDYDETDVQLLAELADLAWDIVVRKRAELALVESEHQLARTMANLPGMVFRCANDGDWTFKFASRGCRDLTGFDGNELVDNRVASYGSLIHPEDARKVTEAVHRGIAEGDAYQVTYRIQPREGPLKWVWEQGRGIFRNGQLEFLEGFIYDVSDQVEAQENRLAMERKVQEAQKLESLGVLAGGIAHDFNNLLQAMLGFAELAHAQIGPGHAAQESLDKVVESATRAAELTRQMLAFSGRGRFTTSRVDISRLVGDMANLLESSVPRSITFTRELEDGLPAASLDVAQFHQVVMNLITNAAEAIGERDGVIRLRTGRRWCAEDFLARSRIGGGLNGPALVPGDYVFVEVQDTGCGMDPVTVDRIFEPFFTTKFTGRGLGLAAVQGIIRGHRGAMFIDSRPGAGSRIGVYFPTDGGAVEAAGTVPVAPAGAPDGPAPLLLVVDDEPKVREIIAATLEGAGYRALLAGDGRQALEIFRARSGEIDAVLLDLVMPQMGGEECLAELRRLSPAVRVVLMSGFTELEMQQRFAGQPIAGTLAKPFRNRQLLEILNKALPAR